MARGVTSTFKNHLLAAGSGLALCLSAASLAAAQCVPGTPSAGDTVTCLAGTYANGLNYFVDDLTVVVGNSSTPTTINSPSEGIVIWTTDGVNDLTVYNAGSTINPATGSGIYMRSTGTGDMSAVIEGSAYAVSGNGLNMRQSGNGNITASILNATGFTAGVYLLQSNAYSGNITLTSTGDISGTRRGVVAGSQGSGDITLNVNNVSGRYDAIRTFGSGDIRVVSTGLLYSDQGQGLTVNNLSTTNHATSITVNDVTAIAGQGMVVSTQAGNTGQVTVLANGTVSGVGDAIYVNHGGTGRINIFSSGGSLVSDLDALHIVTTDALTDGINVDARTSVGAINIDSAGINSTQSRAMLIRSGSGVTSTDIDVTGTVTGVDRGIDVYTYGGGTAQVNITDAYANSFGVNMRSRGGGDLRLVSTGLIRSNTLEAVVMIADSGTGADIYANVNNVTGARHVFLGNIGSSGGISFIANGDLTTTDPNYRGLFVRNFGTGSTYINVIGTISSGSRGVQFDNNVTGGADAQISFNNIYSTGDFGAYISSVSSSGSVSFTSIGTITAGRGIRMRNFGSGNSSITVNNVYASFGEGIELNVYNGTDNVSLEANGNISAPRYAVSVVNNTAGTTHVTTNGTVTSTGGQIGIRVRNSGGSAYVTSTALVSGFRGIDVRQLGSGGIYIEAESIIGTSNVGILANGAASAGHISISTSGIVTAASNGIYASLSSDGTNIEITTGTGTTGGFYGVVADNRGTGDIVVNTNGDVSGSGAFGIGARAAGGAVTIDTNTAVSTVYGLRGSIGASTSTGATITVGANTLLTSGNDLAIRTLGDGADDVTLTGTADGRIWLGGGADSFTLSDGASILSHNVFMGDGSDRVILEGTPNTGTGVLLGGTGIDTLELTGGSFTLNGSNRPGTTTRQFENLEVSSGWTLSGRHSGYDLVTLDATGITVDGILGGTALSSSAGSSLDLGDGSRLVGDATLSGMVFVGGDGTVGTTTIVGSLGLTETSVLNMDVDGGSDLIRVVGAGDISLGGTLNFAQADALAVGQSILLNGLGTQSGTFAAVNGLGSGGGLTQSVLYDAALNKVSVVTRVAPLAEAQAGSKSSASAANYMLAQLGSASEYSQLGFDVGTMASVAEIGEFASGTTPDVLDSAMMVSDGAALRFGQNLAGCDMNFSLNAAESCAAVAGQNGPAMFGEIRQTSANTGTEVGHNFNAQSFDMNFGVRLTDADDAVQFGLMSGYAKSGSVSDAYYAPSDTPNTPLTPAQAGAYGESAWVPTFAGMSGGESGADPADGLEAETFSLGGYARRDLGWWSLDGTAMVSTSEAKLVRNITPGLGIAEQAQSEFVSRQFNLQGTVTLNGLGSLEFWVKPLATIGNRTLQRDGFTESGADLLGLTVDGQTRNVSYAGVGAEFAPDFTDDQGNGFRGLLRVTGLAYTGDTNSDFTARFTNAPGDSSFTYFGQNLDTSVLLEGGFQYLAPNGFAIGAEGFGEVNPETGDSSTVGATLQLIKRW